MNGFDVLFLINFASAVTSPALRGNDEHILCMQDLEMGSANGGGSKLHPADRISGRRSGELPCAERAQAGWSGRLTSPAENLRGAKSSLSARGETAWKLMSESVLVTQSHVILKKCSKDGGGNNDGSFRCLRSAKKWICGGLGAGAVAQSFGQLERGSAHVELRGEQR